MKKVIIILILLILVSGAVYHYYFEKEQDPTYREEIISATENLLETSSMAVEGSFIGDVRRERGEISKFILEGEGRYSFREGVEVEYKAVIGNVFNTLTRTGHLIYTDGDLYEKIEKDPFDSKSSEYILFEEEFDGDYLLGKLGLPEFENSFFEVSDEEKRWLTKNLIRKGFKSNFTAVKEKRSLEFESRGMNDYILEINFENAPVLMEEMSKKYSQSDFEEEPDNPEIDIQELGDYFSRVEKKMEKLKEVDFEIRVRTDGEYIYEVEFSSKTEKNEMEIVLKSTFRFDNFGEDFRVEGPGEYETGEAWALPNFPGINLENPERQLIQTRNSIRSVHMDSLLNSVSSYIESEETPLDCLKEEWVQFSDCREELTPDHIEEIPGDPQGLRDGSCYLIKREGEDITVRPAVGTETDLDCEEITDITSREIDNFQITR